MEYGKFATVSELLKGYNQLEKSFTQKCQQLAETERENRTLSEQLARTLPNAADQPNCEVTATSAEQPDTSAMEEAAQQEEQTTLGTNGQPSPCDSNGGANTDGARSTTVESVETVPQDACVNATPASVDPAPASTNPTEEQLQQYLLQNPDIAQKLLQNVQAEFAPAVMCGGGNVPLAPPSRPKSIKEASLMAKDLFAQN